ncbi:hypothetical protein GCM10023205_37470 [Yinghuangia aomiensis]|uniref:Integral membrane protein n=1 Tax=Yinghuangia aomiensis TaxID=676205 RepID=A0ABP9HDU0_9ACTN
MATDGPDDASPRIPPEPPEKPSQVPPKPSEPPPSLGKTPQTPAEGAGQPPQTPPEGAGPQVPPEGAGQPPQVPPTTPQIPSDQDELRALRARVADLEAQPQKRPKHRVRAFFSALLIVIAAVLAPLSAAAVWVDSQVSDTGRFVATMKPLASNPDVQNAVTNRVTDAVMQNIDVNAIINDIAPSDRPRLDTILGGASGAITSGINGLVRTVVQNFVQGDAFQTLWVRLITDAHQAMVKALTGSGDASIKINNDTVSLDLAPVIAQVKTQLVDQGLGVAAKIPDVHTSFTLVESKDIGKLKTYFRLLDIAGVWLPIITVVVAGAGVLLAQRRRRALVTASLAIAAGVAVLGIGLAVFRLIYTDRLPADVNRPAAEAVYDTLVRYLRASVRMIITLGIIVALGAWLSGPGKWATKVRTGWQSGIGTARSAVGLNTGSFGVWLHRYKTWIVWAFLACAAIALILWSYPTGLVILGITLTFLFALAVLEFLNGGEPGDGATTWRASRKGAEARTPNSS